MQDDFSLVLCLLDFVPVVAFLIGGFFLFRLALSEHKKAAAHAFLVGSLLVFLGGFFKAGWKMLCGLEVADIRILSEQQFVLTGCGFLIMLVGAIRLARQPRRTNTGLAMAAVVRTSFLVLMTICSLAVHGILTMMSFKRGQRLAGWLFIFAVVCMLGMAGMASSMEQTVTIQWLEEGVNSAGQTGFAVASYLLYRSSSALTGQEIAHV